MFELGRVSKKTTMIRIDFIRKNAFRQNVTKYNLTR